MIGIAAIACEIPAQRISNLERMARLDATDDLVRNKIGVLQVARMPAGSETSDLAAGAAEKLFRETSLDRTKLECLAVVTQNPDGHGLPHTAAILHGRLGLAERCATFDISLGCSGFVHGLSIVAGFMTANGMKHGMLVTADPYSKVIDDGDRNTTLLFGDAATATYLSEDAAWRIGRFDFGTDGRLSPALHVDKAGKLVMNGRDVFTFSAAAVPQSIARVLAANAVEMSDIDRIFLHQGSKFIVDTVAKRIGAGDKAVFCAGEYGNTVSSSIPILLAQATHPGDRRVLICGFGVGLTWAATILERVER